MASKRTSEDAKGSGLSAAAPIRPPRTTGQSIPEPASPRDVPEPLGDLPPESVGRGDGASTNRKRKKIPSGPGDRGSRVVRGTALSERSREIRHLSLQAKVESRSSRANRRKV
jgi:hypothetical protein